MMSDYFFSLEAAILDLIWYDHPYCKSLLKKLANEENQ